jgi:ribose/xylose/arabinose/galactoside ABC-type transport system permease subunit/ABC-type sugar transport system substrate-binding protein
MKQLGDSSSDRSDQLLLILSAMMIVAAFFLGTDFANPGNFRALMLAFVSIGFISLGMMALLISGVFDLSVGSVYAVGVVAVAYFIVEMNMPWPLAAAAALAVCALCGALNGLLVTKMKINPLIATLGTMGILRGAVILVGGTGSGNMPKEFTDFGQATVLGFGLPVWLLLITTLVFMFMFRHLKFFRKYYFVGGNTDAARLCGINPDRVWFSGFVIMSLLAGFAGILYCARLGASTVQAGEGMEMNAIAGVVIGGASINGGKGTILGGLMGALFMALVFNIMGIIGFDGAWRTIVIGTILVLAVYTDVIAERGYFNRFFNDKNDTKNKEKGQMNRAFSVFIFALTVGALLYIGAREEKRAVAPAPGVEQAGTSPSTAHADELYIMATMYAAHPVLKPDQHFFKKKGDALGVRTLTVGPPANNLEDYVNAIEQAIAQKPNGLAINGLDPAITSLINKAMDQGIPVVMWDADLPESKRITFIGTDWPALGVRLAEALAPMIDHKGQVGRLGNISQPHIMAAMETFKTHMAKIAPEVEVLDIVDDAGKIDVAEQAANSLLQRYPDIAGIAGFDGSSGSGICPALKSLGKAGKVKVVINDLTAAHIQFLKDGSAHYVSGQKRNVFGPLALQVLFDVNHQKYAFTSSVERDAKLGIYQAPEKINTGFVDVTPDSVDEFEKAQEELMEK